MREIKATIFDHLEAVDQAYASYVEVARLAQLPTVAELAEHEIQPEPGVVPIGLCFLPS